jgi:hypothetical protein
MLLVDIKPFLSSAISFKQGDHLYLDTTNHLVKPITSESQSATSLGCAQVTVVNGLLPAAYHTDVDASLQTPSIPGPEFGAVYQGVLKTGDAVTPGCKLYADPATASNGVTVTAGTAPVGIYQGKALTGVAGQTVEFYVLENYVVGA